MGSSPQASKTKEELLAELRELRRQLNRSRTAAQEAEACQRLTQIFLATTADAVVVLRGGVITQASRAAEKLCGLAPIGKKFDDLFPLKFKSDIGVPFSIRAALARNQPVEKVDTWLEGVDRRVSYLLVSAELLLADKPDLGWVVTMTNVTAQCVAEEARRLVEEDLGTHAEELLVQNEELRIQQEELTKISNTLMEERNRLAAINEEMEEFSYSVFVDLNLPVRTIEGYSRMLLDENANRLDSEGLRLLKVIQSHAGLMHTIIEDLRTLSRLSGVQLNKSLINLNAMTNQAFKELWARTSKRKVRFQVGDLPPAYADQSLLYQVMVNLLDNAIKFTKSKRVAAIEVGGRIAGAETIYYVKDNGSGFNEDYAPEVFRPFRRTHDGEEGSAGPGIGLATVKRIVQRHGGRVWAESKVGKGATFYFTLPRTGQ